jgi:hypothetical protein
MKALIFNKSFTKMFEKGPVLSADELLAPYSRGIFYARTRGEMDDEWIATFSKTTPCLGSP